MTSSRRAGLYLTWLVLISLAITGCVYDGEGAAAPSVVFVNDTAEQIVVVFTQRDAAWESVIHEPAPSDSNRVVVPMANSGGGAGWSQSGPGSETYCVDEDRKVFVIRPLVPIDLGEVKNRRLPEGFDSSSFELIEEFDDTLCLHERRAEIRIS